MDKDYCEIICTAIDEIVTAKLEGLEYDITKLCTITDDTYSYQGKYTVSDGTAKYEAYTTDMSLKKGNSVLVTIPKGDYQLQKTILCRISADDTTPFNYTSPMDTMIKITNNIFDKSFAPDTKFGQYRKLQIKMIQGDSGVDEFYMNNKPYLFA